MKHHYILLVIIYFLCLTGCQTKTKSLPIVYLVIKDKTISVEIAATPEARAKGLMGREKLAPDAGMLFVYPQEQYLRFWMKDTPLPLSIAFIKSDGTISRIRSMYPHNEDPIWSTEDVLYALEMLQGWFERNNIKEGDKIYFPEDIKNIKAEP